MLKMYHRHAEAGGSAAYWEEFGGHATLADRIRFLDVDPLRPLFQRYLKPGSRMLEGGCGRGQYVAYYAARGARVVGLDFAREWLSALRREGPALALCAGDVGALPFGSGTFDLYYSGGVVEHFESGPQRALAEARRVIKDDGVLLISVPYFSPMRRLLAALGRKEWHRVGQPQVDEAPGGRRFYQYAFSVPEFTRLLAGAGFRVLGTQGYALVWGLTEVGLLRRVLERLDRMRGAGERPPGGEGGTRGRPASAGRDSGAPRIRLLKKILVAEDASVPGAGWLIKWSRWAHANMMMFVCAPDARRS
ncbi:MAG: class I SAM-dependent methyltransferase [Acidobacteria bacterium]|nr:class I SAM-dependent methyltransferase [Acidobacteriota bacterium]